MIDPGVMRKTRLSVAQEDQRKDPNRRLPHDVYRTVIYMDAAGAHMWPSCSHSDLWRTTRPPDALMRYLMQHHTAPDSVGRTRERRQVARPKRAAKRKAA